MWKTEEWLNLGSISDTGVGKCRTVDRVVQRYKQESNLKREGCYLVSKGKRIMLGLLKRIFDGGTANGDVRNVATGLQDVYQRATMKPFTGFFRKVDNIR